ncbi:hypothetical protein PV328_007067 [Microctonus aethiopoides]|uniref:peptidylprolyl isomerase n=1 Tax=Microctonus aethiopoides TaxID=144406 RepID=A0AA39FQU8_9HYME|nr:hypothetical protein PV328_007067 [Microctonus aethiopoides]
MANNKQRTSKAKTDAASHDKIMKISHLEYLYDPHVLEDGAKRVFEIDRQNMELMKTLNLIIRSKGKTDCWMKEKKVGKKVSELRELQESNIEKIEKENKDLYNRIRTTVAKNSTVSTAQDWKKIEISKKNKSNPKTSKYSRCFFDIEVIKPNRKLGRIILQLYTDIVPRTCANFIELCKGVDGISYKNTPFHRIISGYLCQGGDVTNFNGSGGTSIYGGDFEDENFKLKHTSPGILSMWNNGKHTNNSKFILTFKELEVLDGKNVVFGKVIDGLPIIYKIEEFGTKIGRPREKVIISECGLF